MDNKTVASVRCELDKTGAPDVSRFCDKIAPPQKHRLLQQQPPDSKSFSSNPDCTSLVRPSVADLSRHRGRFSSGKRRTGLAKSISYPGVPQLKKFQTFPHVNNRPDHSSATVGHRGFSVTVKVSFLVDSMHVIIVQFETHSIGCEATFTRQLSRHPEPNVSSALQCDFEK